MASRFFLLKELVKRDFQARYAGSLLGLLWPFLLPLWQLVLFTFVFSTVMRISPLGERVDSFAIFLFGGLLPWMALNEGIVRSATAVTDNADFVRHSRFSSEILVLAVVLGGLIQQAIAAVVYAAILAATGELSWTGLPLLVVAVPLQVALTLGIGLLVCCFHTLFRDTAQLVGLGMMGWFYLTPIVYPLGLAPERYQDWLLWNPLTVLVALYRQAFFAGAPPGVGAILRLAAISIAVLAFGIWLFRRLERGFADEI